MQEHLTPESIRDYRDRRLRDEALLSVAGHLATCAECREKTATAEENLRLAEALGGGHLRYEDLEAQVKGSTEGAEHVRSCAVCAAELADLRKFATETPPRKAPWAGWRILVPALALAALALIVISPKSPPKVTPPGLEPKPLASLHDGGQVVAIDQAGQLHGIETAGADERDQIAKALRSGEIPLAPLSAELARPKEILLGDGPSPTTLKPQAPVATLVSTQNPTFRWTAPPSATRFRVAVYDTNFELIASSPVLATPQWQSTRALRRGQIYTWAVTATIAGTEVTAPHAPEPEARFRVAGPEAAAVIDGLKNASQPSDLRIAIAAARLGLRDEAEAAVVRLEENNPGSPLAAHLGESIRTK
jgi:hypothetical protein